MYNDIRKNENKGFSLVELIVVIAIMAVMMVVLVPTLLQYVEKSRAQKDDSAMGELVQVIKLALAEQDVYDECLCYVVNENFDKYEVTTDDDGSELIDETEWVFAGEMRGLTITFQPKTKGANDTKFVLAEGIVNMDYDGGDAAAYNGGEITSTLSAMTTGATTGELYNRVLAGVGAKVKLTSQTYRNSDYTVFITMGAADEAVSVYGQWNGSNLPAGEADQGETKNKIAFTLDGVSYEAEEGMTWGAWVNSSYNTAGIHINEYDEVLWYVSNISIDGEHPIVASDLIGNNLAYYTMPS